MLTEQERRLNDVLRIISEGLDIPPSKYQQAVERYEAVGKWLDKSDSSLHPFHPDIYPQGSFRLGTVVRPIKEGKEADYDIDLVCQLDIEKHRTTAESLKKGVGNRLKEHKTYKEMLDSEGKRCWTLDYAEEDGIGFHMDILPSLQEEPAIVQALILNGVSRQFAESAIAMTDKDKNTRIYNWDSSNPRGFGQWFDGVNQVILSQVERQEKQLIFEKHGAVFESVEQVPNGLVRTPLQRAIQILKRHRDMRFLGHRWEDEKPISMILTSLATRAYKNEPDVYTTLRNIVHEIENYATSKLIEQRSTGWYIPNPVNPAENFADRWNDSGSHRAEAFFQLVAWMREDINLLLKKASVKEMKELLTSRLGERVINEALDRYEKMNKSNSSAAIITSASASVRKQPTRVEIVNPGKPWRYND